MARFSTEVLEGLGKMRLPAYGNANPDGHIAQAFDVLAGTSAGALVAAGLAVGKTPSELSALFDEHGPKIFPGNTWLRRLRQFATAKYSPHPLRAAVEDVLGTPGPALGDMDHILVFPTIDETRGVPIVLTNALEDYKRIPLKDAVMASAAAPTYFPAHRIPLLEDRRFIDGGLFANAPDLAALTVLRSRHPGVPTEDMHVVSVGTTQADVSSPHAHSARGAQGLVRWMAQPPARLLTLAMRGTTDHAVDLMEALAFADYIRIDRSLANVELDSATPEAMSALRRAASQALEAMAAGKRSRLEVAVRRKRWSPAAP